MNRHRPGRVTRMLLRAPGHLYDWRCGWLLGHRFLRLTHIGRNSGRHYQTMLEVIMASGFASPYYSFKGGAIAKRDFDQHFSIDLLVKDQTLMLETAAAQRTPMPGLAAIREVCQSARGLGFGQEDIVAVVKALERMAGLS